MNLSLRAIIAAYAALAILIIGFVLFSQYVQHYEPCELCLRERWPWYAAIAVGLAGIAAPSRAILAALALLFLASAALGLHHVGVEQHWWAGPTACTGGATGAGSIDELRAMMHAQQFTQCDTISWTLFGLSMATYNLIMSVLACGSAAFVAARTRSTDHA